MITQPVPTSEPATQQIATILKSEILPPEEVEKLCESRDSQGLVIWIKCGIIDFIRTIF